MDKLGYLQDKIVREYSELISREKESLISRFIDANPEIAIKDICIVVKKEDTGHLIYVSTKGDLNE